MALGDKDNFYTSLSDNMTQNNKQNHKLVHYSVNHPKNVIALTMLLAFICTILSLGIQKNTTPYFLDKQHNERVKEDNLSESFLRTKETIVIVLSQEKSINVFNEKSLSVLGQLHDGINQLDLIETLYLKNVDLKNQHTSTNSVTHKDSLIQQYNNSLSSAKNESERSQIRQLVGQYIYPVKSIKSILNSDDIFIEDDDIVVAPNFSKAKLAQWQNDLGKEVLNNKMFLSSLINKEANTLAVQIELNIDPDDSDAIAAIFKKIKTITERVIENTGFVARYSGSPVINVEISAIMEKDNQRYFPIIVILITLILYLLYQSVSAPLLALSVSVLTILITFGLMSLLGITLNIVTTILPIFIITIGVTDAIHVLSKTNDSAPRIDYKTIVEQQVKTLFRAMLLTSLTTSLGFFSLSFTEITNIRDFGIMVGISTLIAFVISVTTLPALIVQLNRSFEINNRKAKSTDEFWLFKLIQQKAQNLSSVGFYSILTGLIIFSLGGLPHFYVDQQNLESFESTTQIRQDNATINHKLGGTVPISIWISSVNERGILDPKVLGIIEKLQAKALTFSIIGYTIAITDFLDHTNKTLLPEYGKKPSSQLDSPLLSQYLFLLEGGPSRDLESVVSIGNYQESRVVLMAKTDSSRAIQTVLDELEKIAKQLPNHATFEFASYGNMNAVAAKEIVSGQLNSIVISVLGLLLIISLIYKSLSVGMIGLLPLTMSLLAMFGLMGYASIPLDIGSSLLCGVAFGIGIDYSIHIIESYKRMLPLSKSSKEARNRALSDVSFPIMTSAVTISLGFSILMLSDFKPIFNLGLLISITMLISALCSLFIVPRMLQATINNDVQ